MLRNLSVFAGLSYLAYLAYEAVRDVRVHRATKRMDTDNYGNYDLDGVSYDPHTRSVAVTGDDRIADPLAETKITEEVVKLHAPEEPKQRNVSA